MAEFQEVMKQAKRMCVTVNDCDQCELMTDAGCRFAIFADDAKYSHEIERIVMDWAEKHPEPRYPTWREWHKANFPDAHDCVAPCHFMSCDAVERVYKVDCSHITCSECSNTEIPADIADKLGIKPIGGEE